MIAQRTPQYPDLFKVLGDPNRLAIFDLLMQGVQCNCELGDRLRMPMNLISHHLKVLRAAGLVNAERDTRDARWVYYAIDALKDIGIDASSARSKSTDDFRDRVFDLVVTVCDSAAEECPLWLGQGRRAHVGFPDPARGTIADFRAVRDDIRRRVIGLLDAFEQL